MRRTLGILATVGVLIVSFLSIDLAGAQQATPVSGGLTFDVQFHDTPIVADQAKGFQQGDRVILSDKVLQNGTEVGHNAGVCTITDAAGGEMLCIVTWLLPQGTISTQLINTPPPEKTFAIVGGTGTYAGVRGAGTLVEHGDQTGTVTFNIAM